MLRKTYVFRLSHSVCDQQACGPADQFTNINMTNINALLQVGAVGASAAAVKGAWP